MPGTAYGNRRPFFCEAMVAHDPERSTHDPFSAWLRAQLSQMYPEMLSEPLPGEIHKLALELEKKLAVDGGLDGSGTALGVKPRRRVEGWPGEVRRYERKTV